jgi:hypothetical protein
MSRRVQEEDEEREEFECSMDGYVELTKEFINVALFALALVKETYAAVLPHRLGRSVDYAWDGLVSAGSWAGYVMAAAYFFGLEYGYAEYLCQYSGYVDTIIGFLYQFVDFAGDE